MNIIELDQIVSLLIKEKKAENKPIISFYKKKRKELVKLITNEINQAI